MKHILYIVGAIAMGFFIAISLIVSFTDIETAERALMLSLRSQDDVALPVGGPFLTQFMADLTSLAGWPNLLIFTVGLSGVFIALKRPHYVAILVVVMIGGSLIVEMLKEFLGRARPDFLGQLTHHVNNSFPSGHATSAASFFLTLAFIAQQELRARADTTFVFIMCAVVIFLVGASRVFLGVHYPTDILAGWSLGTAISCTVWGSYLTWFSPKGDRL